MEQDGRFRVAGFFWQRTAWRGKKKEMAPHRQDPDLSALIKDAAWVRSLAVRLVGDPHLAEDLSQEVLLAEWSRSDRRTTGPRRWWLAAVLRNLAKMHRRGNARRERREQAPIDGEAVPSTAEVVEQTELQHRVVAEVLALPEPYRGTLLLRYMRERTIEEIARQQGVAQATVRSRAHRGIAMLRERMQGALGPSWRSALLVFAVPAPIAPAPTPSMPQATSSWAQSLVVGVSMKFALKSALALAAMGLVIVTLQSDPTDLGMPSSSADHDPAPASAMQTDATEHRRVPLVAADAPPSAPTSRYSGPGTILTGVVLTRDKRPIEGAAVTLLGMPFEALESGLAVEPIGRATSDELGTFAIPGLAPSVACVLHVTADGYASAWKEVRPGDGATIRLDRSGMLFGTIVDGASHQPVPGVRVRTRAVSIAADRLSMVAESVSDARGRYELAGLPLEDTVSLQVLKKGSAPLAVRILLQGDPSTRRDILLPDLGTIQGVVVTAANGLPVSGAQIRSCGPQPRRLAETDQSGRFTLQLHSRPTANPRDAMLRGRRHSTSTSYQSLSVHAPGFCQTIQPLAPLIASEREPRIVLQRAGGLTGKVVDGEGAPVAGASVYWLRPGQMLVDPGAWIEPGPTSERVRTDDDGTFSMPEVLPGIPFASVAVRRAHQPPHRAIDVSPSHPDEVRDVLIRLDTGVVVRGRTFLNGNPAPAYVHLDGSGGPKSGIMMQTDTDGHFAFHGVLAGDYTIRSCTADGTAVWSDPVALRVDASPLAPLELTVAAPFEVVAGRVVSEDGHPIADAQVLVFPGEETSGILAGMAETDRDGSFEARLASSEAETFTIAMAWEGFRVFAGAVRAGERSVRLVAPSVADMTVELVRAGSLEPIPTATLAFRRSPDDPWSTLFGGREAPAAADGTLLLRLPIGQVELRVASLAAGIDPTTRSLLVTQGGRVTMRL